MMRDQGCSSGCDLFKDTTQATKKNEVGIKPGTLNSRAAWSI